MVLNFFFIAAIVVMLPIFLAVFLARAFTMLDTAVVESSQSLEAEKNRYNPRVTAGFQIPVEAEVDDQLRAARRLAAERAVAIPRGANMRIRPRTNGKTQTAHDGLENDPMTAVRIAAFHGWQGAIRGITPAQQQAAPTARRAAGAAPGRARKPEDLKPGVDYEYIQISDDMSGAETRRARIANAKAKAAAIKALKTAGAPAVEAAPVATPAEGAAQPVAQPAAPVAPAGIPEPDLIEITDDMAPDEVRRARINNAKAEAAYKKALKEAGAEPGAAPAAQPQAATAAEPTPATAAEPAAIPSDIPEPDLIEITDDMSPDQVRQARIHNARAQSAYKKALKEAGIS